MKLDTKTALGIDVSGDRICMAFLKKGRKGVKLLKAASGPVPEGAIKNGSIEEPALLAKGIRELKRRSKIWVKLRQAAVSLVARPLLVQTMDISKQASMSVGQFVHNEMKHCVALSGKKVALDFCGIGTAGQAGNRRLFVVATDNEKVGALVKACDATGVNVEVIEPPLLAYARAFHAKKIAGRFDCNVLMAILRDNALTLCVFRAQAMDYVRTRHISQQNTEPSALCEWLGDEIDAIIKFYDTTDAERDLAKWEITVVADCVQLPEDAEASLNKRFADAHLQVRTGEEACQDTVVEQDRAVGQTGVSPVAIGLAMKLLCTNDGDLRINLLPPEAAEVKAVRRHTLIAGNIAAAVLLLLILASGGLRLKAEKVNHNIGRIKQSQSVEDVHALFKERGLIDKQIEALSDTPGLINKVFGSHPEIDWAGLLNDIGSRTPKTVRITDLVYKGDTGLRLEGLGLSYEAIHFFVGVLNESKLIDSASLVGTEKPDSGGLITYEINCSLAAGKGK